MSESPALISYPLAKDTQRRYPTVGLDLLLTEAHAWLSRHPERLAGADSDEGEFFKLQRGLRSHLGVVALHEAASLGGYEARDVYFFGTDVIAAVLPGLWDENYGGEAAEETEIRSKGDAAEGNNWPVLLADVRRGFNKCNSFDQETLFLAYGRRIAIEEAALDRALKAVRTHLGGARPQGCPQSCECRGTPVGVPQETEEDDE